MGTRESGEEAFSFGSGDGEGVWRFDAGEDGGGRSPSAAGDTGGSAPASGSVGSSFFHLGLLMEAMLRKAFTLPVTSMRVPGVSLVRR